MIERPPRAVWDHLALVMQVGLTVAGSALFGLALGYWLDRWLGLLPLFTIVLLLLGLGGGGYTAYRQIMELELDDGKSGHGSDGPKDA